MGARFTIEAGKVQALNFGSEAFNRLRFCRDGPMLYNVHDQYVGRSLDLYGEYCPEEQAILLRLFPPGGTVIEVGANIGSHTVGLAKRAGHLIAFEPQRHVFHTLCANLALNQLDNVDARQAACGSVVSTIRVPVLDPRASFNFGGVSLLDSDAPPGGHWQEVALVPLDGLAWEAHLIKVDAEGMEADVLRGARELIGRARPNLYVECDRHNRAEELVGLLRSMGYELYWHTPPLFAQLNYAGNHDNVFGNIRSINLLCRPERGMENFGLRPVERHDDLWGASS